MRKSLTSLILSGKNVNGVSSFHDGFEYGDTLTNRGYLNDRINDPDMIADTARDAASTGERGLLLGSEIQSGAVSI